MLVAMHHWADVDMANSRKIRKCKNIEVYNLYNYIILFLDSQNSHLSEKCFLSLCVGLFTFHSHLGSSSTVAAPELFTISNTVLLNCSVLCLLVALHQSCSFFDSTAHQLSRAIPTSNASCGEKRCPGHGCFAPVLLS